MNYKRKSRRRFFLLMRSRSPPISSEFRGGVWTPQTPLGTPSSRCMKAELAQTHIWQWTCKFVKLNCHHIVPPGDITHATSTLFITHLHRMPERTQNSRHSSITTSFLTCTTFTLLHLLLFLRPPICLLTSPLYCHSSSPFLLVLESVTLLHGLTSVSFHLHSFDHITALSAQEH